MKKLCLLLLVTATGQLSACMTSAEFHKRLAENQMKESMEKAEAEAARAQEMQIPPEQ